MLLLPGKCAKCHRAFSDKGRLSPWYSEIVITFDTGTVCHVGFCSSCELLEEDLPDLKAELIKCACCNDDNQITSYSERVGIVEIIKNRQGNKCAKCFQDLGANWSMTNGEIRHEGC